ncbi:SAG-related sequence [Besnoitia besnoiti]|uniref:SAG-related sequence n=1 Tax=Besnoitia besnoiti TaxID=94643 RepID=A0A2A9ME37_BESBE|nr:SAG-related sequence [Besnoitia besnoiti]PFH36255.1 SAG-related sequence [Besnoitia besnoiti]
MCRARTMLLYFDRQIDTGSHKMPRSVLLFALLCAAVIPLGGHEARTSRRSLLFGSAAPVPKTRTGPGVIETGICETNEQGETTCTCTQSPGKIREPREEEANTVGEHHVSAKIEFAGETNTLKLVCDINGGVVPTSLPQSKVCPGNVPFSECKDEAGKKVAVSIQDFLDGESSKKISWKTNGSAATYTLTIPQSAAPLSDKAFWVGCSPTKQQKQTINRAACQVSVALKAKESTTIDGNVVRCAYGATSNEKGPQKVTLSPKANSLTLVCGSEGAIQPTTYNEHFCSGQISDNCSDAYTAVLPDFQKDWWTPDSSGKTPYKLVIPEDKFPEKEQHISVGCKYSPAQPGSRASLDAPQSVGPTLCVVDVTIVAAESSSSAAARRWLYFVSSVVPLIIGAFASVY